MAEPLKNMYGPEVVEAIAATIARVHPQFPSDAFMRNTLDGYDTLELMDRGRKIADALHTHLPQDFEQAADILIDSLGPAREEADSSGMESFIYMPHAFFAAQYGITHFDAGMRLNYEVTKRFTAEFSIRPFIEAAPVRTLALLREWARDPNQHVRRLVSEGTRPRLPWATRLTMFQDDPAPVLELLELLKDDPELYVRRSVANNLCDIGKDNPDTLFEVARRWHDGTSPERTRLVRHALRFAVKQAVPEALAILGYAPNPKVIVSAHNFTPESPRIGESVDMAITLQSTASSKQRIMADMCVWFVKANGKPRRKVFKLKELELDATDAVVLKKRVGLHEMTTRKHYPGIHRVEMVVNGTILQVGEFRLLAADVPQR